MRRLLHRSVSCVSVLSVASALAAAGGPQNILVLLADDLGVDAVACYGEGVDLPSTPHIDALAAEGVLFRNVWATPSCSPTRALIQTGRYAFRTGIGAPIGANGYGLPLSETTLPELLDLHPELGYSHAYFGKWHLGSELEGGDLAPNLAGWSHYAGALDNLTQPWTYEFWPLVIDGSFQIDQGYITSRTVDLALDWIESVSEPWLCFVAFHAVHFPLHRPPDHLHTVDLPDVDPRAEPRLFFRAIVEALDTEIGRLLAGLGERSERTAVLFAGDNGTVKEVVLPPFRADRAKLTPYEGGLRVPLIAAGPIVSAPGREVDHLVSLVDLFGLVAEIAGIDPAVALPGVALDARSFLPVIADPAAQPVRTHLFSEMFAPNGFAPEKAIRMIRGPRYKLIRHESPTAAAELYDLARDPFEHAELLAGPLLTSEQRAAYRGLWLALEALVP